MSDLNVYTTSQINALTPITGDMVVDSDLNAVKLYDGAAWRVFNSDSTAVPYQNRWGANFSSASQKLTTGYAFSSAGMDATISMRVKASASNVVGAVFGTTTHPTLRDFSFGLKSGGFRLNFGTAQEQGVGSSSTLLDGNWNTLTVTISGADLNVYVNGSANYSTTWGHNIIRDLTLPLQIASSWSGLSTSTEIDEFAVWERVLTSSEINTVSASTPIDIAANASTNLKGYYRMGDDSSDSATSGGSIATITDSSGNGNDATQSAASSQPTFSDLTGETIYV